MTAALLLALAFSSDTGGESGVSAVAQRLAAAISTRFDAPEGMVVKTGDDLVFVDIGDLGRGTRLQWFTRDGGIHDPSTLEAMGEMLRPCGTIRIRGANSSVSWGEAVRFPDCGQAAIGDLVTLPAEALRVAVEAGAADPSLSGLVALLAEVVPERLARTGRFSPQERASTIEPAVAEVRIVLRAALRGQRLAVLAEIAASAPRPLIDVAEVEGPLPPGALWRDRTRGAASSRELATLELDERVLALRSPGLGWPPLALTESALFAVRLDTSGQLRLESLVDFDTLPAASQRQRRPAGTIAVGGPAPHGPLCFSSTDLARGWCRHGDRLDGVDGVPVEIGATLLVAHRVPGCAGFDGILDDLNPRARAAFVGPFLAIAGATPTGALVARDDGSLERLAADWKSTSGSADQAGRVVLEVAAGDAWQETTTGILLASRPVAPEEPDQLIVSIPGRPVQSFAVSGSVVALADMGSEDGVLRVLLACESSAGSTRLVLLEP